MKRNYSKELEKIILDKGEEKPELLLHSCCAPCSSYVLEYLGELFDISLLYYNPNISSKEEYDKRSHELERLVDEMPVTISELKVCEYDSEPFYEMAKGLESLPEGGERCEKCYELRLRAAAETAKKQGSEYFTTTLSISPMKSSEKLNNIGEKLAEEYGVKHLPSDFKKKEGYKRSIELSRDYNLYRQDYCGCIFSKARRNNDAR